MNIISSNAPSKVFYWLFLIGFFFACLITGIIGYEHYFTIHQTEHDIYHSVYKACQLFTFEGGDLEGYIPLELQIIRFAAPVVSLAALIGALWDFIKIQWLNLKISFLQNHVVVVGLGQKGLGISREYTS
ncbi:MAG: hypothetical protein KDC80_11755, partial [Saprospiraceae bacterium]|nr:hypothetical protein [Saprospiraceae bacterium]